MLKAVLLAGMLMFSGLTGAAGQSPAIEVQHAWARATPPGARTAVVYMTLVNQGAADDRLLAVTTPAAGKAELHSGSTAGGIMRMRPVEGGLAVMPGKPTELKPGGDHIMLVGLKAPLVAGQTVTLTLTFEKAGKVDATATIEKVGSMGPKDMPGMKM